MTYRIDCPEKGQVFGQKAKQFTSGHAFVKSEVQKVKGSGLDNQQPFCKKLRPDPSYYPKLGSDPIYSSLTSKKRRNESTKRVSRIPL